MTLPIREFENLLCDPRLLELANPESEPKGYDELNDRAQPKKVGFHLAVVNRFQAARRAGGSSKSSYIVLLTVSMARGLLMSP